MNEDRKGSFPILHSPRSKDIIIDSSLLEYVSQQGFPKGPTGQALANREPSTLSLLQTRLSPQEGARTSASPSDVLEALGPRE